MRKAMKRKRRDKKRDPVALAMLLRAAKAGKHPNRKKRANKHACRKKVQL